MYYLSAVLHVKNEAPYLDEWISYHRGMGVEHFWIYDNGSTDNVEEAVRKHSEVVELIKWPQVPAFPESVSDCLRRASGVTTWLALLDADEFLVPDSGQPEDLINLLKEAEPWAGQVVGHWRNFGSNGHLAIPQGRVTDNYLYRDGRWYGEVKSIVRPEHVSPGSMHWFHTTEGWPRWDSGRLHVFHYRQKSKEDFFIRDGKGQVDGFNAGDRLWHWLNNEKKFNDVYDGWASKLGRQFNTPGTHRELGLEPIKVVIFNHNQPNVCQLKEKLSKCFDVSVLDSGSRIAPACADHKHENLYWTGCMNKINELYPDRAIVWAVPGDVVLPDTAEHYKAAILSSYPFGLWSPRIEGKSHKSMKTEKANGIYDVRFIEGICFAWSNQLAKKVFPLSNQSVLGWGQDVLMSSLSLENKFRNVLDARVAAVHEHAADYQSYDPVEAQAQMDQLVAQRPVYIPKDNQIKFTQFQIKP